MGAPQACYMAVRQRSAAVRAEGVRAWGCTEEELWAAGVGLTPPDPSVECSCVQASQGPTRLTVKLSRWQRSPRTVHLRHFQYEEGSNPEDADSSLGGHFPSPAETVQNPTRIPIRHNYFCGWVGWSVFRGGTT